MTINKGISGSNPYSNTALQWLKESNIYFKVWLVQQPL